MQRIWLFVPFLLLLATILAFLALRPKGSGPSQALKVGKAAVDQIASPTVVEPARPLDRLPLLEMKAEGSIETFRERYSWVLTNYRNAAENSSSNFQGKFAFEKQSFIRETRLLALSYPDLVETQCGLVLKNPDADPIELSLALWALEALAKKGRKGAVNALVELARNTKNPEHVDDALFHLSAIDDPCDYRALYWDGCRQGASAAFKAISYQVDGGTISLMEELLRSYEADKGAPYRLKLQAKLALQRQTDLASGAWQKKAIALLEEDQGSPDVSWALRSGRLNQLPGMVEVLRRRLSRAEGEANLSFSRYPKGAQREAPSHEVQFATWSNPIALRDKAYDEVLVAFMEMGGELNDLERKRLRTFGYAGNPEERLSELILEKR